MIGIRIAAGFLVVAAVAPGAAPASAQGQRTPISMTMSNPQPDVGEIVVLETDVLESPPYNTPGHEVWFVFCRDLPPNCNTPDKWRRVGATDANGNPVNPPGAYVCRSGNCVLRVRLGREANITFVAFVMHNGRRVANSRRLGVSWKKRDKPPPPPVNDSITLKIEVEGKSCTAKLGEQGASRRYPTLVDRCIVESPKGVVKKLLPNGSTEGISVSAAFTGLKEPEHSIMISWRGEQRYCTSNPCTFQLPGYAPGAFSGPTKHVVVGASILYDHKLGPRAVNPLTKKHFDGLQAEIEIDFEPEPVKKK